MQKLLRSAVTRGGLFLLLLSALTGLLIFQTGVTTNRINAAPDGCWPLHSTTSNRTGPNVFAIQYLIRRQGYTMGVDGIFGNETRSRVINVQSANGLSEDGIVGPNTWQSGLIVTLSRGAGGDGARAIQHLLRYQYGYDIGDFGPNGDGVDGDFGQATHDAVVAFQQARGIAVDGVVGSQTWSELVCLAAPPTSTSTSTATHTPRPATDTPTQTPTKTPTHTSIPPTNTSQPPADEIVYPSGVRFAKVALNQVRDGIDYTDAVAGGRIPLIDLLNRLSEKLHMNFTAGEFQTNDGARYARIAPKLIQGLQLIRNRIGGAVVVNSGYRHPAYNQQIGGADGSRHMTGEAADINVSDMSKLALAEIALEEMGCDIGIGLYAGHVHVDVRGSRSSWVGGDNPPMSEADFDQWVANKCSQSPPNTPTATDTPAGSNLCWTEHSRRVNSISHNVYAIQYLLKNLGESLDVDGIFGPETEAKVIQLQQSHGVTASGVVNGLTWQSILIQRVESGDSGDAVRALQHLLARKFDFDLGMFGPGSDGVDGDFGQQTHDALIDFQELLGLAASGVADAATWSKLICESAQTVIPTSVPLPTPDPTSQPPGGSSELVAHVRSHGFDACTLPTVNQMGTWQNQSPYDYIGIYIGGENRGCNAHNREHLTVDWVSQTANQGWRFIPIWVGPQAPGNSVCNCSEFSCNVDSARAAGVSEAQAAAAAANALGLTDAGGAGTIIYYDLEAHNGSCRDAAKAFLDGWVSELHELGNQAGVYGSSRGSYIADFAAIDHVPDAVWPANWLTTSRYTADASAYGISGVPDSLWRGERIRQYAGGHDETYGGVRLNIDSDVADGPVATSRFRDNSVSFARAHSTEESRTVKFLSNQPEPDEIHFLTVKEGWILVDQSLSWTLDGGKSWLDITPPLSPNARIDDVYFINSDVGWMVTNDGTEIHVLHTDNRGQQWDSQPLTALQPAVSPWLFADAFLYFLDEQTGWITLRFATSHSFKTGVLLQTLDGGLTWNRLDMPIGERVTFISSEIGWLAGGPGGDELHRTVDAGQTWARQEIVAADEIDGRFIMGQPVFSSTQHGTLPVTIIDGEEVTVVLYVSADGGQSWVLSEHQLNGQGRLVGSGLSEHALNWLQKSATGLPANLQNAADVNFVNADVGWAQTSDGTCTAAGCEIENRTYVTGDGGESWDDISLPPNEQDQLNLFLPLIYP